VISISVTVDRIVIGRPKDIWQSHGADLGVSLNEFEDYFSGTDTGCAIFFTQVDDLSPGVALSEIRAESKDFHPPQFFKRLRESDPELRLFRSRLVRGQAKQTTARKIK
jgi:predicted transcriptional regulator